MAKDPVCGMTVETDTPHRAEHEGKTYYFCSAGCRAKFVADPGRYLTPSAPDTSPSSKAKLWTCPMHPQIVRDGPGSCPLCGMALEPMTPSADEGENPELTEMTRRFWVSLALSVPLVIVAMGHRSGWIQLGLAAPVVLWGGWPFFVRAAQSVWNKSLNMFTLIGLGV